ncbi:MAG: pyridoxal 5'-phosphate synthase glutaminase subunit PdxT [Acidimicrobiales bacterium]
MTDARPRAATSRRRAREIGVLGLQGDVREHVFVLSALGANPRVVRCPSDLRGIEALVLPGGESTTMSMLLHSSGLDAELERLIADELPMLGTCAGMILLASEVLDGRPDQACYSAIDLSVRRNGFGRQVSSFETDIDVKGLDAPMHAVFIRAPAVERTGSAVDVLAEIDVPGGYGRRPVVCSQDRIIVSSFHPELAGDGRLHELLLSKVEGD